MSRQILPRYVVPNALLDFIVDFSAHRFFVRLHRGAVVRGTNPLPMVSPRLHLFCTGFPEQSVLYFLLYVGCQMFLVRLGRVFQLWANELRARGRDTNCDKCRSTRDNECGSMGETQMALMSAIEFYSKSADKCRCIAVAILVHDWWQRYW